MGTNRCSNSRGSRGWWLAWSGCQPVLIRHACERSSSCQPHSYSRIQDRAICPKFLKSLFRQSYSALAGALPPLKSSLADAAPYLPRASRTVTLRSFCYLCQTLLLRFSQSFAPRFALWFTDFYSLQSYSWRLDCQASLKRPKLTVLTSSDCLLRHLQVPLSLWLNGPALSLTSWTSLGSKDGMKSKDRTQRPP